MLRLLLSEGEHCSIEQRIEGVIVELADRHVLRFVLVVALNQLLEVLEHLSRLACLHRLLVFLLALLSLLLLLRIEVGLILELLICLLALIREMDLHLLQDGALAHGCNEGLPADIGPQLLLVISLRHLQLI